MYKENCGRIPQQRLFINTLLSLSLKVRKTRLKMLFLNTLIPPKSPLNLRIFFKCVSLLLKLLEYILTFITPWVNKFVLQFDL